MPNLHHKIFANWTSHAHFVIVCFYMKRELDGWAYKPGLTHISLVHSPRPTVVLRVLYHS